MSTQITTAFVQQFKAAADLVVQQLESQFRDKVNIEPITGEKAFFDFVGKVEPQMRTSRHGDTVYSDTPHSRRMVVANTYDLADLIDRPDEVQTLIDPASKYMQAFRAGFARKIDEIIINAALGTAYSGKSGTTPISFPASQIVAHGNAGLTVEKLIAAQQLFLANDVPEDWEKWCAVSNKQIADLLKETEVGSFEYNELKPLVAGKITKFMGFNFVHTEQLPTNANSHRQVICWAKPGITLAIGYDIEARVDQLPTKNYSTQVFMSMRLGASRMQEELVVQIPCVET